MDELLELAERCEAARGGCMNLSEDIWRALHPTKDEPAGDPGYTTTIDAAIELVPEGWDYSSGIITDADGDKQGHATVESRLGKRHAGIVVLNSDRWTIRAAAPTPALALCAAALRARARASTLTDNERLQEAEKG